MADALFNALKDTNIILADLELGNGLTEQLPHYFAYSVNRSLGATMALNFVASNLKHLTLSIKDGNEDTDSEDWRGFFASAKALESLRTCPEWGWSESVWHSPQEFGTIISAILPHEAFANLHTFEIVGKLNQPTNVRVVWLQAFLTRHASTLRRLELSGVLLFNWYSSMRVRDTMRTCLRNLRNTLSLVSAKALISRRGGEHANEYCWGESKDGLECDKSCRQYLTASGDALDVQELERLAGDLGVQLKDGVWDFGEFLMRP